MKRPIMDTDDIAIARITKMITPDMTERQIDKLYEREVHKQLQRLNMQADKLFHYLVRNLGENNDSINALVNYLEECGYTYAKGFREQNRDFIRWSLQRNIDHNKKLIKALNKVEKKHNLPSNPSELDD